MGVKSNVCKFKAEGLQGVRAKFAERRHQLRAAKGRRNVPGWPIQQHSHGPHACKHCSCAQGRGSMSLHKFKTRTGQGHRLTTLVHNVNPRVSGWLSASQDTHMLIPTRAVLNVNASPSMDVSVNFGPLSSISLHCKDAAAGAKGVLHRCLTKGVPHGHMADTGKLPEYTASAHASSQGPDWCDTHSAARHKVARDGAAVCCSAFTCLNSLGALCSQGRRVPHKCMGTSHPQGPTAEMTPFRQRSNLLQPVVFRADVERMLAVPELQQRGPIPVRAASLNY